MCNWKILNHSITTFPANSPGICNGSSFPIIYVNCLLLSPYCRARILRSNDIIIIIKYQVYIALISNKCSEALNSATQNIIYKHSILITSVITMKP